MAVNTNAYGTVAQVQSYLKDTIGTKTLTTTTNPTLAEVEDAINSVANQINSTLKNYDYIVPISSTQSPDAYGYVRMVNSMGAAAIILSMRPSEPWENPGANISFSRRAYFENKLFELILAIQNRQLSAATGGYADNKEIVIGSQHDSNGRNNLPLFRRSTFDYPGSRELSR